MTEVSSKERFFDFGARKKFGIAFEYGQKIYGQVRYGAEEPKMDTGDGSPTSRFGIYQVRHEQGRRFIVKENFYIPSNPQTIPQQAWRTVFANGMAAWALLTDAQKKVYHTRASKLNLHGVNLFLREWLNSN